MQKTSLLFMKYVLKNIVSLVVFCMLIMTDAAAKIDNCEEDYGSEYCYKCYEPYVVAGNGGYINKGNSGQGTHCVIYCGDGVNGNENPAGYLCKDVGSNVYGNYTYYSYEAAAGLWGEKCYYGSNESDGSMTVGQFCEGTGSGPGVTHGVCKAGYYDAGHDSYDDHYKTYFSGVNQTSCTNECPSSDAYYTDSGLTKKVSSTSQTGATKITDCYIPSGTYYDSKGKFELTGDCSYSN